MRGLAPGSASSPESIRGRHPRPAARSLRAPMPSAPRRLVLSTLAVSLLGQIGLLDDPGGHLAGDLTGKGQDAHAFDIDPSHCGVEHVLLAVRVLGAHLDLVILADLSLPGYEAHARHHAVTVRRASTSAVLKFLSSAIRVA